jgi:hypothetical protein
MSADFRSVRKILWEDWDPIGCGVPKDEYDDYAPGACGLLLEKKAGVATWRTILRATAAETIGARFSEELGHVADALLALGDGNRRRDQ